MRQLSIETLLDREYFGMKLGLEKIKTVLERLEHPERKYRTIHVAGTNGKGSTATMIARILEAGQYRVGLFTSPHLQHLSERFQINGREIHVKRLEELIQRVNTVNGEGPDALTFFEWVTVIAFLYFAEEEVDVAVIECGMGGRLDATNVLQPDVTCITSIAYDHQKHLGNRIDQIAREKGGIIKAGVPLICSEQRPSARKVLRAMARQRKAPVAFVDSPQAHPDGTFSTQGYQRLWIPAIGRHQFLNASTAVATAQAFVQQMRSGSGLTRSMIDRGLAASLMPGRMELASRRPLILLDGAHNSDAITHLTRACVEFLPNKKFHCLFGAMADKDIAGMLRALRPLGDRLHIALPLMKRAAAYTDIVDLAKRQGWQVHRHADCATALRGLESQLSSDEALLVTGSLFLVGEARSYFQSYSTVAA